MKLTSWNTVRRRENTKKKNAQIKVRPPNKKRVEENASNREEGNAKGGEKEMKGKKVTSPWSCHIITLSSKKQGGHRHSIKGNSKEEVRSGGEKHKFCCYFKGLGKSRALCIERGGARGGWAKSSWMEGTVLKGEYRD